MRPTVARSVAPEAEGAGGATGDAGIGLGTGPEDGGGNAHEDAWDGKRPPVAVVIAGPGNEREPEHGPEIDRGVEEAVDAGKLVVGAGSVLVADEGGDAGLDASGAEGDEREAGEQPVLRGIGDGDPAVPEAVEDREEEDGAVAPEPAIGDEAAEDGEEVHAGLEQVDDFLRVRLAELQLLLEIEHQDRDQAVVREAFTGLHRDDEGNGAGGLVHGGRMGQMGRKGQMRPMGPLGVMGS